MKNENMTTQPKVSAAAKLLDEITPLEMAIVEERMVLAARIADIMDRRGWNRVQFAGHMGKKPSVITKWLSGTHNFTHDTLVEIAFMLNISLPELLGGGKEIRFVSKPQFIPRSSPIFIYKKKSTRPLAGKRVSKSVSPDGRSIALVTHQTITFKENINNHGKDKS
ncbi:MAG: helix-turn-helix domain-containing protein [Leadbetterella sp.]|nr:helix-turn-helix domain-containing protein [Leadbetterella sp.]